MPSIAAAVGAERRALARLVQAARAYGAATRGGGNSAGVNEGLAALRAYDVAAQALDDARAAAERQRVHRLRHRAKAT